MSCIPSEDSMMSHQTYKKMCFLLLALLTLLTSQAGATPVAVSNDQLEKRQGFLGGLVGNLLNSMFCLLVASQQCGSCVDKCCRWIWQSTGSSGRSASQSRATEPHSAGPRSEDYQDPIWTIQGSKHGKKERGG